MLELENALHDFRGTARLLDLHRVVVLGHNRLLLRKVALALEHEVRA